jgi:hypothetical protein
MTKRLLDVVIVKVPDRGEAIYIDGQLDFEARWIDAATLVRKLEARELITGSGKTATEDSLTEYGQFPQNFSSLKFKD